MTKESDKQKSGIKDPSKTGASQPNQSLWDAGKAGEIQKPPADAVPPKPDQK